MLVAGCAPAIPPTARVTLTPDGMPDDRSRSLRMKVLADHEMRIAYEVERLAKRGLYPGVSAGIVMDGQLVFWAGAGFADVKARRPVTRETVFRIASITKTMTGMAVLQLRDAGALRLDDPVARVVPELGRVRQVSTDSPPITWRHLVTHTSGLPRTAGLDITLTNRGISMAEVSKALNGTRLIFSPGTDVNYSNLGWAVVGIGIGRLMKMPFREYLSARLLEPLGIRGYWEDTDVPAAHLARGHGMRGKRWESRKAWRLGAGEAMGGLYMSADSLARWLAFQMDAWPPRGGDEGQPVRRATVRESQRIAGFGKPGAAVFGIGWGLAGTPVGPQLAHTGATWASSSVVRVLPEAGVGILMLTNGPNSREISRVSYQLLIDLATDLRKEGVARGGRASPARFKRP